MWPVNEVSDPNGYTPSQCFVYSDSYGDRSPLPCTDIIKLRKLQHGKKMVNMQIKMWVETTLEIPLSLMPSEVKEITKEYPSWVYESYIRQLKKKFEETRGYVPSFCD